MKLPEGRHHKILKPKEAENFAIRYIDLSAKRVKHEKYMAVFSHSYGEVAGLKPGRYTTLVDKRSNSILMSDTWMEAATNQEVFEKSHGDVLIAGLGIGFLPYYMQKKPEVDTITVVELEQEVIDLVSPILGDKVTVIHDNIFAWPIPDRKWNIIYFDIWDTISSDNWEGMKRLTKRFKYKVDRTVEPWVLTSWKKEKVKSLVAEERRFSVW